MPQHTLNHEDDWLKAEWEGSLQVALDGALELLADNAAPNQYFSEIDEFGDAEGYPSAYVPSPDGYLIGVSKPNGPEPSITFQNLSPLGLWRPGYLQAQPIIEGRRPERTPGEGVAKLSRPSQAPRVVLEDAPRAGFTASTVASPRYYRYTYVTPDGLHTDATDPVSFTNANGQSLRCIMPDDVPEGLSVGIFVSPPGKRGGERLQRVWDPRRGDCTLSTFRYGRRVPTRNETYLGSPRPYRFGKDVRRDRYDHGNLTATDWRFSATYVSDYGEGPGAQTREVGVVPGTAVRRNEAWWVSPPPRRRGAAGWRLYAVIAGVSYLVVPAGRIGGSALYFSYAGSRKPRPVTGEGAGTDAEGVEIRGRFKLIQQDPPSEDASGIEGPQGEPAPPVGVNSSYPPAARYRVLYAPTLGDEVGLASPVTVVDVPAGKIMRVTPPVTTNLVPNAEGVEVNALGIPFDWTVSQVNGTYEISEGVHRLATTGAIAQASGTPTATSGRIEVTPDKPYSVAAKIRTAALSGTGRIVLNRYASDGSNSPLVLADVGGTDYREVAQNVDLAGAVALELRADMAGATRNMSLEAYDLGIFPFAYVPPKVSVPTKGTREPADFAPPADTPYPAGTQWAVGPAPGPVTQTPEPPLSTLTFEDAPSLANGTAYNGWTVATNRVSEVRAQSAIDGSYGWHVADSTVGAGAVSSMYRTFSVPGDSLGERVKIRCLRRPTWAGSFVALAAIAAENGARLGAVYHYFDAALALVTFNRTGTIFSIKNIGYFGVGDVVDLEIIATNAGANNGSLDALVGKNGEKRSVAGAVGAIDWRGLLAKQLRVGLLGKSDARTLSEYDFDTVQATPKGAVIEDSRPPSTQIFVPDAPARSDGSPMLFGADRPDGAERINRLSLFVHPEQPEISLGLQDVPLAKVKPGQTYAVSLPGRHVMPTDAAPWYPWSLSVRASDGASYDVGSLHGDAGCSGTSGWGERSRTFTVPERGDGPPYTTLCVSFQGFPVGGGLFLWQGPLKISEGVVAKEGYGRKSSGTIRVNVDTRTRGDVHDLPMKGGWLRFGVLAETPDGTSVASRYRATDDPSFLSFPASYQADKALVGEREGLRVEAILSGNGILTPRIPLDGIAVATRPFDPQLLRGDRSELYGGCLTKGLEPYHFRPEYAVRSVRGRDRIARTSDAIGRLPAFSLQVFTEDARCELEETWAEPGHEWIIEDPSMGGTGKILRVKARAPITFKEGRAHVHDGPDGPTRHAYAVAEGILVEVLDVGGLA